MVKIIEAAPTCFGSHEKTPYNDMHIGTRYVILAKHWMWLPDDGFM